MSHDYYNHFIEGSKELLCVTSIQAGNTTWHCNLERHTNITPKGNSDHGRKTWNLSRNSFPHHSLPNTESIKRTILFWSLNKALVLSGVSILRYFHINQVIKNSSFLVYFIKKTPIFGNRVTPPSVKLLYLDLKPFKLCYGCLFVISRW